MLRNLAAVVSNYREAGIGVFVLAHFVRDRDALRGIREAVGVPLRVVRGPPGHELAWLGVNGAGRLRPFRRRTVVAGICGGDLGSVMDEPTVSAYLDRIEAQRPGVLDEAALRALHRAHLMTVPFENLSIHLNEPISLAEADLVNKIVTRRRGGFCYELNGAFALLLEALGADVVRVAARVHGDGRLGPPFDHLALVVSLPGGSLWLADVGFGSHSTYPLRFDIGPQQDDPAGRFALADAGAGDVDVLRDGQPQYRIERRERSLDDFVPACWWQQTWPGSHFTQSTICSRLTEDGRISLSGRTLIRTSGRSRSEEDLPADDAVLAAYRDHFGVILDRVPAVTSA